jgi:fatty acid desaturase
VAAPILSDMQSYSRQHSIHHKDVGTANDPDLANYAAYPISKASLMRKFSRDLVGVTGLKYWMYLLKTRAPSQHSVVTNKALLRGLMVNFALWLLCYMTNQAWLFLIWVVAFHTVYFLFLRIRHVGEHAAVPNASSPNMFENTRTTRASWWERLFVSPVYVNYHVEHHLLPSVPPYKLPTMHKWLVANQAYKNTAVPAGYIPMLRSVLI